MSKQLANNPEAVAPGPNEGAGVVRISPENEPRNAPPQAPAATARLPRSLSNDSKTLPSEEAKPNDFERTKVGICKLSSTPVQANSILRRESVETFPCKPSPGAGIAGQAAIPHCKIPALQSTDGDATVSLGKGTLEQNNAKGAWVTLSQSTVVLGTDGNTSVLPGRVEGVSCPLTGFISPASARGGIFATQHRFGVGVLESGADESGMGLCRGEEGRKKGTEDLRPSAVVLASANYAVVVQTSILCNPSWFPSRACGCTPALTRRARVRTSLPLPA